MFPVKKREKKWKRKEKNITLTGLELTTLWYQLIMDLQNSI